MALTKVSTPGIKDEAITLAKLLHGDSNNNGKFLRANNGADPTFETVNTDLVSDTSPQLGGDLDVNTNNILFGDSASSSDDRLKFGAGTDLSIYHDGTDSIIQGGDPTVIRSNLLLLKNFDNSESYIRCHNNGAVELYHDNSKKINTGSKGAAITGGLLIYTDSTITGTPLKYLYGHDGNDLKNGLTIQGNEAGLELIGTASGDHSASVLLRNLNDGFALINNNDQNRLEIKHFTATSDNFNAHGNGNNISTLKISATFNENGSVDLYNNNTKRFETAGHGAKVSGYLTQTAPVGFCAYRYDTGTANEYPLENGQGNVMQQTYFGASALQDAKGQLTTHTEFNNNGAGGSCFSHNGTKFTAPIAGVYQLSFHISLYVVGTVGSDNSVTWGYYKNQSSYPHGWTSHYSGLNMVQSTPWVLKEGSTNLTDAYEIASPSHSCIMSLAANDEIQIGWSNMSIKLGIRSFTFSGFLIG